MSIVIPNLDLNAGLQESAFALSSSGLYIGPLRGGSKNPGSILGEGWPTKTVQSVEDVADLTSGAKAGTGLFIHCGRSGLVVVDVDAPQRIPTEWWEFLREAPFQSTRSNVIDKGHYFFRIPDGRMLGNSNGRAGTEWGEIRGRNGVVVTQPTRHEKSAEGGRYHLVRGGEVFDLPAVIADLLYDTEAAAPSATKEDLLNFMRAHSMGSQEHLIDVTVRRFYSEIETGEKKTGAVPSRHQACLVAACELARESAAGFYPAAVAYQTLKEAFEFTMRNPTGYKEFRPRWEYEYNDIWCWAISQVTDEKVLEIQQRRAADNSQFRDKQRQERAIEAKRQQESAAMVDEFLGGPSPFSGAEELPARETEEFRTYAPPKGLTYPVLPEEFWNSRVVLQHIRTAAHAMCCGGDVVLYGLLSRLSSMRPYGSKLQTGLSATSLNLFVAAMGESGTGKSSGLSAADSLAPIWSDCRSQYRYNLPLGSGQGIPSQFMGKVGEGKEATFEQVRHNVHFACDEGEIIARLAQQKGDQLPQTLRTAWSGGVLGQSNATEDRSRLIAAGSYCMGLSVGFQPGTATTLFDDSMGGTPQRFTFTAVCDPSIPLERIQHPGPLDHLEHLVAPDGAFAGDIEMPDSIKDALYLRKAKVAAGLLSIDELDTHAYLMRARLAALLALLDLRMVVNEEDWHLAGIMYDVSRSIRTIVKRQQVEELNKKFQRERERSADIATYTAKAVSASAELERVANIESLAQRIRDIAAESADGARLLGRGGIKQRIKSSLRGLVDDAIESGQESGLFTVDDGIVKAKKARKK